MRTQWLLRKERRVASRNRPCDECHHDIEPGEEYELEIFAHRRENGCKYVVDLMRHYPYCPHPFDEEEDEEAWPESDDLSSAA